MAIRLTEALSVLSDEAKLAGRSDPVIYTDLYSALHLRTLIHKDLGGELPSGPGYISMFDGVKICIRTKDILANRDWREHFGILAELEAA